MPSTILATLTCPELVLPALQTATRDAILQELVSLVAARGLVSESSWLLASLVQREEAWSTAFADRGFALPHLVETAPGGLTSSFLVLARATEAVVFDLKQGTRVDLFFLLCCRDRETYSSAMQRLLDTIRATPLLERLRQAPDRQGMYDCLAQAEQECPRG